jgi:hypothetical protein
MKIRLWGHFLAKGMVFREGFLDRELGSPEDFRDRGMALPRTFLGMEMMLPADRTRLFRHHLTTL